jgi:hypothetical protein
MTAKTYITDLRHFLDEGGELADSPPRRTFARFLASVVEAVSGSIPMTKSQTDVRCCKRGCGGSIEVIASLVTEPIHWRCSVCERQGSISDWQGCKWDKSLVN